MLKRSRGGNPIRSQWACFCRSFSQRLSFSRDHDLSNQKSPKRFASGIFYFHCCLSFLDALVILAGIGVDTENIAFVDEEWGVDLRA